MKMLRGECLCGSVKFEIPDDLAYSGYCHCSECRKFSGSSFSVFAGVKTDNIDILSGADNISYYEKTEDSHLGFCSKCGSSLFSRKPKIGLSHIRMGCLNEAPTLAPQAHLHVASKATWDHINDELPKFDQGPPQPPKP